MKKTSTLLLIMGLCLTGCQGHTTSVKNGDTTVMKIGDTTYTKNDIYNIEKAKDGATTTMTEIQQMIYNKEIGTSDAIKKEAQKKYNAYAEGSDDFEANLKSSGYTKESYINEVLIPTVQADKLVDKYFKANKKSIQKEYKPSSAIILECNDKKTADKALQALKTGTKQSDVFKQYQSSDTSFSDEATLITAKTTGVPTRLINTLAKQKKTGLIDEVFESNDSDSKAAYVAILKSNKYESLSGKLKESLVSDSDFASECLQFYLKKYNFEIHDQDIFDYLKNNNPQYLIHFPELSQDTDDSNK